MPESREARTQRLLRDRDAARAAGRRVGGSPPYGWRSERGQLVPVAAEQWRRALILHMARTGWSLQKIADELGRLSITPRSGRTWTKSTLGGIVQRAAASCPACADGSGQHELSCTFGTGAAVS